jgi:hypothetical protein
VPTRTGLNGVGALSLCPPYRSFLTQLPACLEDFALGRPVSDG